MIKVEVTALRWYLAVCLTTAVLCAIAPSALAHPNHGAATAAVSTPSGQAAGTLLGSGTAADSPFASQVSLVGDPGLVGQWSAPFDLPAKGIHSSVLPTGKVLLFSYPVNEIGSDAWLWDPGTGATTNVSLKTFRDIFCVGQSFLADGRVFMTGGHVPGGSYGQGVKETDLFDPMTETWTRGPNLSLERWYPSNVELGNGKVLVFGGQKDDATSSDTVESYDPATNTLTRLPDTATKRLNTYPRLHLLPSGKISYTNAKRTELFNPQTSSWTYVTNMLFGGRGLSGHSVLLPGLNKVLEFGGKSGSAAAATNTAEIIDFSEARPRWQNTAPMNFPRMYGNGVVLADGTVLMVGGGRGPGIYDNPVMETELFDPATETWTVKAAQLAPRIYHSTAVLLPDGRVLSAGQDKGSYQFKAEVYSPPYLFKGARPSITTAPSVVGYNQSFSISTPEAASISRVALVRPDSVTHSVNFDQRYVDLPFSVTDGGTLRATSPLTSNHAPPGSYMLFVVSSTGVPSVAAWVTVSTTAPRPAPAITGFSPASGPAGTSVAITGSDFTGASSVTFAGTAATFTVDSDTHITATVPDGATTGRIAVTTAVGVGQSSTDFEVPAPPTITGFSPASGPTGTIVVVAGENFTGTSSVTFAGTAATFTVDSDEQITTTLPDGAATGRLAVTNAAGTATSSSDFVVVSSSAPVITSFVPTKGPAGTSVTITGANFAGTTSVTFAGVAAAFSVSSETEIVATVPTGTTSGPIAVTTPEGQATSSSIFTVTTYRGTVLADGPAAYWRLAETEGNAMSEVGSLAGGTYTNGVARGVDGALVTEPNRAASFDGVDDYVNIPDNNALDVGDVFTYELWMKRGPRQGVTQRILHKGAGTASLGFGPSNRLVLIPGGSSATAIVQSRTTITDQVWHHVVVTKNGAEARMYIDRVDVTLAGTNTTMTNNSSVLNIGRSVSGSAYFDGAVDEVAIYPVALTPNQVLDHFWAR